jgi:hypothetical protein
LGWGLAFGHIALFTLSGLIVLRRVSRPPQAAVLATAD